MFELNQHLIFSGKNIQVIIIFNNIVIRFFLLKQDTVWLEIMGIAMYKICHDLYKLKFIWGC